MLTNRVQIDCARLFRSSVLGRKYRVLARRNSVVWKDSICSWKFDQFPRFGKNNSYLCLNPGFLLYNRGTCVRASESRCSGVWFRLALSKIIHPCRVIETHAVDQSWKLRHSFPFNLLHHITCVGFAISVTKQNLSVFGVKAFG